MSKPTPEEIDRARTTFQSLTGTVRYRPLARDLDLFFLGPPGYCVLVLLRALRAREAEHRWPALAVHQLMPRHGEAAIEWVERCGEIVVKHEKSCARTSRAFRWFS